MTIGRNAYSIIKIREIKIKKLGLAVISAALSMMGATVAVAQDDEAPAFELPSKVVPVEIYACNFRDGQGPGDLDQVIDGWSGYMDDNDIDTYAAWTLTKQSYGPDQGFDFLWLGAWTDGNAMGTGMDMFTATGGEHFANFMRVSDCNAHTMAGSLNYKATEDGTPQNALLTFASCNIADDATYPEVAQATREWAALLTDAGSQASIFHWFPTYGGGGDTPDFLSLVAYPDFTELGADFERLTNGEMFRQQGALFGDLVNCDVRRVYNAQVRRSAQLRE